SPQARYSSSLVRSRTHSASHRLWSRSDFASAFHAAVSSLGDSPLGLYLSRRYGAPGSTYDGGIPSSYAFAYRMGFIVDPLWRSLNVRFTSLRSTSQPPTIASTPPQPTPYETSAASTSGTGTSVSGSRPSLPGAPVTSTSTTSPSEKALRASVSFGS